MDAGEFCGVMGGSSTSPQPSPLFCFADSAKRGEGENTSVRPPSRCPDYAEYTKGDFLQLESRHLVSYKTKDEACNFGLVTSSSANKDYHGVHFAGQDCHIS